MLGWKRRDYTAGFRYQPAAAALEYRPDCRDHGNVISDEVNQQDNAEQYLYPAIEPYRTGRLRVSELHDLYYEEVGNPDGKPVVFLHGGPGGGVEPLYRRFFDPQRYRVVLFDQRGAGRSTPHASLEQNTTQDLVEDIEKLRRELDIERWQVFGGSWGSTLALAYAEAYPERCREIVLRGVFLLRQQEIDWFYQRGGSTLFPDAWEHYLAPIPEAERDDLLHAYHRRLTSDDAEVRLQAARAWSVWEASTSRLYYDPALVQSFGEDRFAEAFARIECHYFINHGFLREGQLLQEVERIRHIPAVIVQGRYDVVCPMESAWALHRAWPEVELVIVPDAGHSVREPGIARALVEATDRFAML
jgi:proline iminopeptidase